MPQSRRLAQPMLQREWNRAKMYQEALFVREGKAGALRDTPAHRARARRVDFSREKDDLWEWPHREGIACPSVLSSDQIGHEA
jgi:hypothetical protein